MPKLNLSNTEDLTATSFYRIFLYGDNRTGKTTLSSTFPCPLFIVPDLSVNEMRALKGMGIPVVTFGDIESCKEQTILIADAIAANRKIGPYVPKTIVIDNMTSALQQWKDELRPDSGDRLDWDAWGKIASTVSSMMAVLHMLNTHTIWIAHSRINKIKRRGARNKVEEISVGGYTLDGQAKNILPSHCDLLLYTEATDTIKGPQFWVYTQKRDIWPAGVRLGPEQKKLPIKVGPRPHYDDFAPFLDLPLLEEAEAE